MSRSPLLTLNNGVRMPALGLGVFLAPARQTAASVEAALDAGYRLIDTAAAYLNERAVGDGIRASGVARPDVFVTTKAWVTQFGYEPTLRAFAASNERLGLGYIDLFLLHWPLAGDFDKTIASYKAAEKLLAAGEVRAIGVSNFLPRHLRALRAQTEVVPAVNQVELHPYFIQAETRRENDRLGTVTQSWAPIGGIFGRKPEAVPDSAGHPLENEAIVDIAGKYGKSPAQVIIRWHLDHGFSVIPKSVDPGRIAANIDVFDFRLTRDEIDRIDALDTGRRAGPDPETFTVGTYEVDVDAQ